MRARQSLLDLRQYSGWAKPWAALGFLPRALKVVRGKGLRPSFTIHFSDRQNVPLGLSAGDCCYPVSREEARRVADLVIQVEDRRFARHHGVDLHGLSRAILANLRARRVWQGGSTITQQLVRNTLLFPDRSLTRKLLEIVLALAIERRYTKEEILHLYCQSVFLGPGVRGFEAAARLIYRRQLSKLAAVEICGLVALLRTPSRTFPGSNLSAFLQRRAFVAKLVLPEERITPDAEVNPVRRTGFALPRWDAAVRRQLIEAGVAVDDVAGIGLTIDRALQGTMDRVLREVSVDLSVKEVAAVAVDHASGAILLEAAWQRGAAAHTSPSFEVGLQPGSTYKTFALLAAVESGLPLDLALASAPFVSECLRNADGSLWRVRNYGHRYRGYLTLREALRLSDNTVFARLVECLSLPALYDTYARFGLANVGTSTPAVALGAIRGGTSLLKIALAYAAIANGGVAVTPRFVRLVRFRDGTWWAPTPPGSAGRPPLAASDAIAALRSALRTAVPELAVLGYSGKTGTTRTGSLVAAYDDRMSLAMWVQHTAPQAEGDPKSISAIRVFERYIRERLLGHRRDVFAI